MGDNLTLRKKQKKFIRSVTTEEVVAIQEGVEDVGAATGQRRSVICLPSWQINALTISSAIG